MIPTGGEQLGVIWAGVGLRYDELDLNARVVQARISQLDEEMNRRTENMGRHWDKLGRRMSIALTAPLTVMGARAVNMFAGFESSLARAGAVAEATSRQLDMLTATARDLGATTPYTARQAADGMTFLAMAGFNVNQTIAAMPNVLQLAASAQLDLATAADITTNILTGYGMAVEDLSRVNDVLVSAMTGANTNLQQLGEAMKYAGPVAQAAGVEFAEAAAAISLMSNAGIQGSMAGTSLRGAITRLLNPVGEARRIFERYNIELTDTDGRLHSLADIIADLEASGVTAGEMMVLFGQRAGPAMQALVDQGAEALARFTDRLEASTGTAARIAEQQMDTLHGSFIQMRSAFEEVQLTLLERVEPSLRSGVDLVTELARAFADLPGPVQSTTLALMTAAAVAGPLVIAIRALSTSLSLLLGPVGLLVGAAGFGLLATLMHRASAASRDVVGSATEVARGYNQQARELRSLIEEYDRLAGKPNRSEEEHQQLQKVMERLADIMPSVATGYSELGEALENNIDRLRDYADELERAERIEIERAARHAEMQIRAARARKEELDAEVQHLRAINEPLYQRQRILQDHLTELRRIQDMAVDALERGVPAEEALRERTEFLDEMRRLFRLEGAADIAVRDALVRAAGEASREWERADEQLAAAQAELAELIELIAQYDAAIERAAAIREGRDPFVVEATGEGPVMRPTVDPEAFRESVAAFLRDEFGPAAEQVRREAEALGISLLPVDLDEFEDLQNRLRNVYEDILDDGRVTAELHAAVLQHQLNNMVDALEAGTALWLDRSRELRQVQAALTREEINEQIDRLDALAQLAEVQGRMFEADILREEVRHQRRISALQEGSELYQMEVERHEAAINRLYEEGGERRLRFLADQEEAIAQLGRDELERRLADIDLRAEAAREEASRLFDNEEELQRALTLIEQRAEAERSDLRRQVAEQRSAELADILHQSELARLQASEQFLDADLLRINHYYDAMIERARQADSSQEQLAKIEAARRAEIADARAREAERLRRAEEEHEAAAEEARRRAFQADLEFTEHRARLYEWTAEQQADALQVVFNRHQTTEEERLRITRRIELLRAQAAREAAEAVIQEALDQVQFEAQLYRWGAEEHAAALQRVLDQHEITGRRRVQVERQIQLLLAQAQQSAADPVIEAFLWQLRAIETGSEVLLSLWDDPSINRSLRAANALVSDLDRRLDRALRSWISGAQGLGEAFESAFEGFSLSAVNAITFVVTQILAGIQSHMDALRSVEEQAKSAGQERREQEEEFNRLVAAGFVGELETRTVTFRETASTLFGLVKWHVTETEEVLTQASEQQIERWAQLYDQLVAQGRNALRDAFSAPLGTGFAVFTRSLRESVHESVRDGLINAFTESQTFTRMMAPLFQAMDEAIAASFEAGVFNPAKFWEIFGPAMEDFNAGIADLEGPLSAMQDVLAMLQQEFGLPGPGNPGATASGGTRLTNLTGESRDFMAERLRPLTVLDQTPVWHDEHMRRLDAIADLLAQDEASTLTEQFRIYLEQERAVLQAQEIIVERIMHAVFDGPAYLNLDAEAIEGLVRRVLRDNERIGSGAAQGVGG